MFHRTLGLALCAFPMLCQTAAAQDSSAADYPTRPVRIIVSTVPGGGVDSVTRVLVERLRQAFGQTFIVDNRAGAGGTMAAEAVFRADPDGYTLLTTHPGPLAGTAIYKRLGYDPLALSAVAILSVGPMVIVGRSNLPYSTLREVIAYAKANPGKLTFGSSGTGTVSHLTMELLKHRTGIQMVHVPYRGSAPAMTDLMGGQFDLLSVDLGTGWPSVEGRRAKLLATTLAERLEFTPNFPTVQEQGVPNFQTSTWFALMGPPRLPAVIAAKLNRAAVEALNSKEAAPQLAALKVQPGSTDVAGTDRFIRDEAQLWSGVIHAANINAQ